MGFGIWDSGFGLQPSGLDKNFQIIHPKLGG